MPSAQPPDDPEPSIPDGLKTKAQPPDDAEAAEHLLKLTKVGRPFHKDTADLFATFIVAIELKPHRAFFKTYPNTFSTDEALQALSKLKFSQSTRTPDSKDTALFITTTTNFVFSMTPPVAMELCQHFMDARYIRNALDPSLNLFKDRSLHALTPKGLHVLERFIEKTGIDADHLQHVLSTEIICPKLFHVERGAEEDNILFPYNAIITLFRWFVGLEPNYTPKSTANLPQLQQYSKSSKGIGLSFFNDKSTRAKGVHRHQCFDAVDALEWLCDFTSVSGREEAAEAAAHFERLGLISLIGNTDKWRHQAIVFSVYGTPEELIHDPSARHQGEFRCVNKAYYQITEKGRQVAGWDSNTTSPDSLPERTSDDSTLDDEKAVGSGESQSNLHARPTINDYPPDKPKVTSSDRLHYILKEQSYRSLFRSFLQEKYCEEHILYWIDVDAINRKFNVTSSAFSGTSSENANGSSNQVKTDRKRHHQTLLKKAVEIYKLYLHPTSPFELNTNYTLRNELFRFIDSISVSSQNSNSNFSSSNNNNSTSTNPTSSQSGQSQTQSQVKEKETTQKGTVVMTDADLELRLSRIMSCNGDQLRTLLTQFNQIQAHTFRVMLTDTLSPFMHTEKFVMLQKQLGDMDLRISGSSSALLPGSGGAFISYSYLVN
ncbi:hypothetical protein H0H93_014584 [Arthromyces matolae]|nr:hypothetical protein H0H93_014584 [Arthromyces matolae]